MSTDAWAKAAFALAYLDAVDTAADRFSNGMHISDLTTWFIFFGLYLIAVPVPIIAGYAWSRLWPSR